MRTAAFSHRLWLTKESGSVNRSNVLNRDLINAKYVQLSLDYETLYYVSRFGYFNITSYYEPAYFCIQVIKLLHIHIPADNDIPVRETGFQFWKKGTNYES